MKRLLSLVFIAIVLPIAMFTGVHAYAAPTEFVDNFSDIKVENDFGFYHMTITPDTIPDEAKFVALEGELHLYDQQIERVDPCIPFYTGDENGQVMEVWPRGTTTSLTYEGNFTYQYPYIALEFDNSVIIEAYRYYFQDSMLKINWDSVNYWKPLKDYIKDSVKIYAGKSLDDLEYMPTLGGYWGWRAAPIKGTDKIYLCAISGELLYGTSYLKFVVEDMPVVSCRILSVGTKEWRSLFPSCISIDFTEPLEIITFTKVDDIITNTYIYGSVLKDCQLIVAAYKGNQCAAVDIVKVEAKDYDSGTGKIPVHLQLPEGADTLKAMVWDENLQPQCPAKSIDL